MPHGQLAASPKQYAPTKFGVVRQARTFVLYGLNRPWRDGTSAISFDPPTFIERLAALVPPPRAHQLTYHGVLAPASA